MHDKLNLHTKNKIPESKVEKRSFKATKLKAEQERWSDTKTYGFPKVRQRVFRVGGAENQRRKAQETGHHRVDKGNLKWIKQ